jgi:hypothetical protein
MTKSVTFLAIALTCATAPCLANEAKQPKTHEQQKEHIDSVPTAPKWVKEHEKKKVDVMKEIFPDKPDPSPTPNR